MMRERDCLCKEVLKANRQKSGYEQLDDSAKMSLFHSIPDVPMLCMDIDNLNVQIQHEISRPHQAMRCGFVTFKTFASAAIAAQTLQTWEPYKLRTTLAPEYRDIYWPNLNLSVFDQGLRRVIVAVLMVLLIAFFLVPVAFFTSIASPENIDKISVFHFIFNVSPTLRVLIVGFVPSLGYVLLLTLVLPIMHWLSRFEGFVTLSEINQAVFDKFFFLQVFNFFLVSAVAGSFFSIARQILDHLSLIFILLGSSLPAQSTFFISYISIRSFIVMPWFSTQFPTLLYGLWYYCREKKPPPPVCPPPDFGGQYPMHLLVFVVALSFSVIAPLILPFALICFIISHAITKYEIININKPRYESGGSLFRHVFGRLVTGLVIFQCTMVGYFAIRDCPLLSSLVLPLIGGTVSFYYFTEKALGQSSAHLTREEIAELDHIVPTRRSLEESNQDEDKKEEQLEGGSLQNAYFQEELRTRPVDINALLEGRV
jgi:hypothetical protein